MDANFRETLYQDLNGLIDSVGTPKFFDLQKIVSPTMNFEELPIGYGQFLKLFGNCRLFKIDGIYQIGVFAPKVVENETLGPLWRIGFFDEDEVFLKVDTGSVMEGEFPHDLANVANSFEEWLDDRIGDVMGRIPEKEWQKIKNGPKPFSKKEQQLVEAIRLFRWEVIGANSLGDLEIKIKNESNMKLPFLTIGVIAKDRSFEGRIWVNIKSLEPGEEKVFTHNGYKELKSVLEFDYFEMEIPSPGEQIDYWEFRSF